MSPLLQGGGQISHPSVRSSILHLSFLPFSFLPPSLPSHSNLGLSLPDPVLRLFIKKKSKKAVKNSKKRAMTLLSTQQVEWLLF